MWETVAWVAFAVAAIAAIALWNENDMERGYADAALEEVRRLSVELADEREKVAALAERLTRQQDEAERVRRTLDGMHGSAWMLDRPCWVTFDDGGKWFKQHVVAVSHKGKICVRNWDDESGKHAWWLRPSRVERCVRFSEPEGDVR